MTRGSAYIWLLAARPKTLGAAVAPVVMAAGMAYGRGTFHGVSVLCALAGALLIQIGTNFANDYFDFVKGTDTDERTGPARATQAGLVSPGAMRRAAILVYALALIPGAYIIYRGGWPFAVIGALSIVFGVLYTGGPYPLGYIGLSDPLVLIFFGPVALGGTYYLQTLDVGADVIVAGLAPGFISVALLTVNNLRDLEGDRRAGKKTLAARFGPQFAKIEYLTCVSAACVIIPLYFYTLTQSRLFAMLALVSLALSTPASRIVLHPPGPAALNRALAQTGALLLVYSFLFALCWVV